MLATSALKASSSAPLSRDLRRLHSRALSLHSSSRSCSHHYKRDIRRVLSATSQMHGRPGRSSTDTDGPTLQSHHSTLAPQLRNAQTSSGPNQAECLPIQEIVGRLRSDCTYFRAPGMYSST